MLDAIPKNEVDGSEFMASRRKHHWSTSLSLSSSPSPPAVLVTQGFKNFQAEWHAKFFKSDIINFCRDTQLQHTQENMLSLVVCTGTDVEGHLSF